MPCLNTGKCIEAGISACRRAYRNLYQIITCRHIRKFTLNYKEVIQYLSHMTHGEEFQYILSSKLFLTDVYGYIKNTTQIYVLALSLIGCLLLWTDLTMYCNYWCSPIFVRVNVRGHACFSCIYV